MSNNISDKKSTAELITEVNKAIDKIFSVMGDHEKIITSDLIHKVGAEMNVSTTILNGLVSACVKERSNNKEGLYVKNGRNGGVFKGVRIDRIDPRERCTTCKQVVRPKSSKMSLKNNDIIDIMSEEIIDGEE